MKEIGELESKTTEAWFTHLICAKPERLWTRFIILYTACDLHSPAPPHRSGSMSCNKLVFELQTADFP